MEDCFKSINHITMMEVRSKDYHQPEYDSVSQVSIQGVHEVSMPSRYVKPRSSLPNKTHFSPKYNSQTRSTFRNTQKPLNSQYSRDPGRWQYNHTLINLRCYYCQGDYVLKECNKFSKENAKYKFKSADMLKKFKDKIMQQAKNENVSINKVMLTTQEYLFRGGG